MNKSNKLHFIDSDFLIYFPSAGNEGRSIQKYGVAYRDRKKKETQNGPRINLENVLALPSIKDNYPHNIGYYKDTTGKGKNWTPKYLETRVIRNEEELLEWIKQIESVD